MHQEKFFVEKSIRNNSKYYTYILRQLQKGKNTDLKLPYMVFYCTCFHILYMIVYGGDYMQAEQRAGRGNGYIITGSFAPKKKAPRIVAPSKKPRIKINIDVNAFIVTRLKSLFYYYTDTASSLNKHFLKTLFSFTACLCSLFILFQYFSFGTAIFYNGERIAVVKTEKEYTEAMAKAKGKLNVYNKQNILSLRKAITLYPRKKLASVTSLSDSILLCFPEYTYGYTLYSNNASVFTTKSKKNAEAVIDKYIKDFSMNGIIHSISDTKIKKEVVKKDTLLSINDCEKVLLDSGTVNVVSVVNAAVKEAIPYETLTQKDETLYLGESVVLTEGVYGTKEISRASTYKNGLLQSQKTTAESVTSRPIAKIVRSGTKQKDILKTGVKFPIKGTISSHFGTRWGKPHEGIDIAADEGTKVIAAECGTVSHVSEDEGGYGKYIKIDHGFGKQTAYAHLSKIEVSEGQVVSSGQQIALSGNTGKSTGPHLHFEIIENGKHINPYPYMKK